MDFDVLARLRRMESEIDKLRFRIAELERKTRAPEPAFPDYPDPAQYKRLRESDRMPIWPLSDGGA